MLRDRLNEDVKTAMKARDQRTVSTLRMVLAGLKDRDIAARPEGRSEGLRDPEIVDMLQKMVRSRQESIELYRKGGRDDLVQQESQEIAIIERYLPQQMEEAEIAGAIDGMIAELSASGIKDMGRVMAALKERYAGRMPMAKVGPMVRQRLA